MLNSLSIILLAPVLVPGGLTAQNWQGWDKMTSGYREFDFTLLHHLSQEGVLNRITRLELVVDRECSIWVFINNCPSLLHLGLTVVAVNFACFDKFFPHLRSCRAPGLAITVLGLGRTSSTKKLFTNSYVERLTVSAPGNCNLNLHLEMERLKEVNLEHLDSAVCNKRSPLTDRALHRPGLCAVHLSSVYGRCPNVITFAGLPIGQVSQHQSFKRWRNALKSLFYLDYLTRGGEMDIGIWTKRRWFKKQEEF